MVHIKTALVLGTAREGRRSEHVAKAIHNELIERREVDVTFVDVRDSLETFATARIGKEDDRPHKWRDIASSSEGFVFVIPEYNHGYPGEWKLLMDSLYKKEYMGKVAALVGVSDGNFGGARAVELAMLSLATRGMHVMKDALHFIRVQELFDENGTLVSEDQKERVKNFINMYVETISQQI